MNTGSLGNATIRLTTTIRQVAVACERRPLDLKSGPRGQGAQAGYTPDRRARPPAGKGTLGERRALQGFRGARQRLQGGQLWQGTRNWAMTQPVVQFDLPLSIGNGAF